MDCLGGEFWFYISLVGVSVSRKVVSHLSLLFIKGFVQTIVPYYIPTIIHSLIGSIWFFPYKSGITWFAAVVIARSATLIVIQTNE